MPASQTPQHSCKPNWNEDYRCNRTGPQACHACNPRRLKPILIRLTKLRKDPSHVQTGSSLLLAAYPLPEPAVIVNERERSQILIAAYA